MNVDSSQLILKSGTILRVALDTGLYRFCAVGESEVNMDCKLHVNRTFNPDYQGSHELPDLANQMNEIYQLVLSITQLRTKIR